MYDFDPDLLSFGYTIRSSPLVVIHVSAPFAVGECRCAARSDVRDRTCTAVCAVPSHASGSDANR